MTTPPRAKRHSLYFLSVFDGRTGEPLGQLADISQEGISILSSSPLKPHETYLMRILLAQHGQPERRLEFEAESRWTAPDPDSGQHTTGFHISLLTAEQRVLIDQLVSQFGYDRISDVKVTVPSRAAEPPSPFQRFFRSLLSR